MCVCVCVLRCVGFVLLAFVLLLFCVSSKEEDLIIQELVRYVIQRKERESWDIYNERNAIHGINGMINSSCSNIPQLLIYVGKFNYTFYLPF